MPPRLALALGVLSACAPEHQVDGRPYALSVPFDAAGPFPLVVLLHGYGASGAAQDVVLPFSGEAKRFLYAQPNGTIDAKGKRFWNATEACCNDDHLPIDDVGFLRHLIADVKSKHAVDRVFLIGHSNGGFMALRMACEAGDVVSGVMSLAGAVPPSCAAGPPVAALLVHGTADDVIRFGGTGEYVSARGSLDTLAAHNGCGVGLASGGSDDFIGDATAETSRVAAQGCPSGGKAELWTVNGEGHIPLFHAAFHTAVIDWLLAATR